MVDIANPGLFRKKKVGRDMYYYHCAGEYVIRKLLFQGSKRRKWGAEYIGPTRGPDHEPMRGFANTLGEMMKRIEEHYIRTPDDARERAIRHLRKGEHFAALDAIFDYIDFRFDNLEREIDGRFDNLKISISSGGNSDGCY